METALAREASPAIPQVSGLQSPILAKSSWREFRGWGSLLDSRFVFFHAGRVLPWAGSGAVLLLAIGFSLSLFQGIHGVSQLGTLHVPAVWLATLLLLATSFWSALGLALDRQLPLLMALALAPTGGMFTFLALWSGSLWMRAVDGLWWIGDARQIAEMLMFGVYMTILALPVVVTSHRYAERASAVVALLGSALVVLLFFLADGWNRLNGEHTSVLQIDPRLFWSILPVAGGLFLYATYVGLVRLRCLIKERELGLSEVFSPR